MTTAQFTPFTQSNLVLVVVGLVTAAVAGAGFADARPFHVNCQLVQSNNTNNLFLGDPGASVTQSTTCELRFFSTSSGGYLKLTRNHTSTSANLAPWTRNASSIDGAAPIKVKDNPAIRCHVTGNNLGFGGNRQCRFSLWQLSPHSEGVVVRLSAGSITRTFSLQPARIPPHAHQIAR